MSMLKSLISFSLSLIKFICYHKTEICSMYLGAVEPYVCVDHNDVTRVYCGLHVTVTLPPALWWGTEQPRLDSGDLSLPG